MSDQDDQDDLRPTMTEGYKPGQKRTAEELARMDAEDESLNRWKASLGIGATSGTQGSGPKVTVLALFLTSPSLPAGKRIEIKVSDPTHLAEIKKNPINIKEGVEYNVGITFKVNHSIISGVRYIHVVKRSGITMDKLEQMLGSYGPSPTGEAYNKNFNPEESPSGLLARSGTYIVKSRVVDDDNEVYADFGWSFKISKDW